MAMHGGSVRIAIMPTTLFCALFLILSLNGSMLCNGSSLSSNVSCMQSERQALLSFKQHLQDPSNQLASWVGEDCCNWYGVVCSKTTGHVNKLILGDPNNHIHPGLRDPHDQFPPFLSGEINPALVELKHLRQLDLSNTAIGGTPIPEFLGSLGSLRHLNLSYTCFGGMIPRQLGNLTNLHSLDLSNMGIKLINGTWFFPYAKNLQWLSQLSSLQYLDMSEALLKEASDWVEVTNSLPSLAVLRLRYCDLNFKFRPIYHVNFSSLSLLDLSRNYIGNYSIPPWVFNLRRLTSLHLNDMLYGGPIFEGIQNLTSLVHLDLSFNYFNTSIPNWLYSLSHLEVLNLGNNQLRGTISSEIKNLTSITILDLSSNQLEGPLPTSSISHLCKLKEIDLSGNKWNQSISQILDDWSGCLSDSLQLLNIGNGHIYDHLTNQIGHFKALTRLSLQSNSISGPIPASFKNLTSLRILALSDNQLVGTLPDSLGQFVNLEELLIDNNRMEGVVSQAHFANTSRLKHFFASGNSFHLKVGGDWAPPFQLKWLDMSSWHLGTRFPLWIKSQTNLNSLGLFNTGLQGVLPSWFSNFSSELSFLNLCHNQLHGRILDMTNVKTDGIRIFLRENHFEGPLPSVSSKVWELDLSDNQFSGSISQFVCNTPNKTMSMEVLNLAKNRLVGKLPNCWSKWKHLSVLLLSYNQFSGSIPSSFSWPSFLASLHLRSNNLVGNSTLSSFQNSSYLITLDLSQNKFEGNIPAWIGTSLSKLRVLSVGFNKFYGHIPTELCALNFLQIMDLSNNNLSGPIPKCFNNFSNMALTNAMSQYFLYPTGEQGGTGYIEIALLVMKGKPLEYNKTLRFVNIIDLSSNSLSGNIPLEITSLPNLVSLNLSYNHLEGEIPTKIGNMSALESIDFSMNRLSGEIPPSMASLNFLSHLNLSYNNLSGHIPTGTQLQSFDPSSFIGNHLCGPPLTVSCTTNGETTTAVEKNNKEDDNEMMWWFYIGMPFGFVAGFWGVFGFLVLNRTRRHAYFLFLDNVKDRIHVVAVLKLGRLRALITSLFSQ